MPKQNVIKLIFPSEDYEAVLNTNLSFLCEKPKSIHYSMYKSKNLNFSL